MSSFHDSDVPMIEERREWETKVNRAAAVRFRNLMIAGLAGLIVCIMAVVWIRGN